MNSNVNWCENESIVVKIFTSISLLLISSALIQNIYKYSQSVLLNQRRNYSNWQDWNRKNIQIEHIFLRYLLWNFIEFWWTEISKLNMGNWIIFINFKELKLMPYVSRHQATVLWGICCVRSVAVKVWLAFAVLGLLRRCSA